MMQAPHYLFVEKHLKDGVQKILSASVLSMKTFGQLLTIKVTQLSKFFQLSNPHLFLICMYSDSKD